jgi:hypothetical protein
MNLFTQADGVISHWDASLWLHPPFDGPWGVISTPQPTMETLSRRHPDTEDDRVRRHADEAASLARREADTADTLPRRW